MSLRWESGEPERISDFLLVLPGGKLGRRTGAVCGKNVGGGFWEAGKVLLLLFFNLFFGCIA